MSHKEKNSTNNKELEPLQQLPQAEVDKVPYYPEPVALVYHKGYIDLSRDELISVVKKALSDHRFEHCVRVEQTAIGLARHYGVDEEAASICGLSHDWCKELSKSDQLKWLHKAGLSQTLSDYGSAIVHGPVAAYRLKHEYGLTHKGIYDAIWQHTIGGEHMDDLARVLFVADYIEPKRDFSGVEIARNLARTSLKEACDFKISHSLEHLVTTHKPIYPEAVTVYNKQVAGFQEH
ncbi:bis(5'-nucleosyl)-tetraphosphatase (symmetrical) YqeK [Bavariicoccus seileri]|uniref:bis(5'-nucleosyl)-tetraphosphatase (symmetrical) YqeK n=1 Tax=Bavariicoccus seileri TaxID=549685 RepID=UPI003F903C96